MDNLFNMLSGFSAGHEKALKQGIYNAVALFLLCLVSAAGYGLYIIMSPFIKPLIWALLCGSVLFPFKYSLATTVQSWFAQVEASQSPLIVNVSLLPVHIFDNISENLGSFLWTRVKYIVGIVSLVLATLGVYHYTPNVLTCLAWRMFQVFTTVSGFFILTCNIFTVQLALIFCHLYLSPRLTEVSSRILIGFCVLQVSAILVGYLTILYIYWTPSNSNQFRYMSFVIWFIITMYLSSMAGTYRVLVFAALQILCAIGFIYEVVLIMESQELNGRNLTFSEAARFALTNNLLPSPQEEIPSGSDKTQMNDQILEEESPSDTPLRPEEEVRKPASKFGVKSMSLDADVAPSSAYKPRPACNVHSVTPLRNRYLLSKIKEDLRMSLDMQDDEVDTDKYMYGALYACIAMLLWKHRWMSHILVIPLVYYIVKQVGGYFGFWEMIRRRCGSTIQAARSWCLERHQALIPSNIRGLYKVSIIVDEKLRNALNASVNAVATTSVILGLIVFTTCASIFITIQVK